MTSPQCPFCGEPAELVYASAIYKNRPDLEHKQFWRCKQCSARVGVHPNTVKPVRPSCQREHSQSSSAGS